MLVTEALVATYPAHRQGTFSRLLASTSGWYFVLLGSPFAAALLAKALTQFKVARGTLTKAPGTPSMYDLISDDNGNVDLYDFQYVLFNILALLIVIVSFAVHPDYGLPDIPVFIAVLTGISALIYAMNKATAVNTPQITSVMPSPARVGDVITITGVQLFSPTAREALPAVTIGGISATKVATLPGAADTVTAVVTDARPGTIALAGTVDVVVTPPLAAPITARDALTVVPDQPAIMRVEPQQVTAGALVTVTGSLLLAPGTSPGAASPGTTSVGGVTPSLSVSGVPWPATAEGPYSDYHITIRIGPEPASLRNPGVTGDATLTLTRTGQQASTIVSYSLT
jgi:hypothetical protein